MRNLLFTCVPVLVTAGLWAQSAQESVDQIRKRYAEVDAAIAGKGGASLFRNEVVTNAGGSPWPAVGTYTGKTVFYYGDNADAENPDVYPETLVKIVVDSQSAARIYHYEYLYDAAGALVFYFLKTNEGAPFEQRIYFRQNKAFRVVTDGSTRDVLNADDNARVQAARSYAARLEKLFAQTL